MLGKSKRSILMAIGVLATFLLLLPPLFAGTGLSLKGDVAIGKDTATRALDVVGKGAFLDTAENNYEFHQLLAVGWRGGYFEATHAENGSRWYDTNALASPPGTVSVVIGDDTLVTSTLDHHSFGNVRFAASGKLYGDLGLYPLSDTSGNGLFRFSCTGIDIDPEPNARVGVGSLIVTGRIRGENGNESYAPHALDVKGEVDISGGDLFFNRYGTGYYASIFVEPATGDLFAQNENSVAQQLTSHRDPRQFSPNAMTSFGDPAVEIPFSVHHKVNALGKGAVVDMSKMVAYLEKKMKEELGEEAGKLVYVYTLPTPPETALKQWEDAMAKRQVDDILAQLGQAPWIKVELGEGRRIPAEAVEEVPEMKKVRRTAWVEKDELDLEAMTIRRARQEEVVTEMVPAGNKIRRLKNGWIYKDGGLYRRPTIDDIDLDGMIAAQPAQPQWVRERLQAGQQLSLDAGQFKQQIMTALQERFNEGNENQVSQAGGAE